MRDLLNIAEKVKSLLISEGVDITDRESVSKCLTECVAPTIAQKAFDDVIDNAPFERIKKTYNENEG